MLQSEPWVHACIFVAGLAFGAVLTATGLYIFATFAAHFLKLHICQGHVEHEYELANPNLKHPTPTR